MRLQEANEPFKTDTTSLLGKVPLLGTSDFQTLGLLRREAQETLKHW